MQGSSLLELVVVVAIASIILLVMDNIMAGMLLTRATLERAQSKHHQQYLLKNLFTYEQAHAGFLGCRTAVEFDDLNFEPMIIEANTLTVHNTVDKAIILNFPIPTGTYFLQLPESFTGETDTFIIANCESGEMLQGRLHGQHVTFKQPVQNDYQLPVYLLPVVTKHWYMQGSTLYLRENGKAHALLNNVAWPL